MLTASTTLILFLASNAVNAQVTTRRRTSSVGRIVAGVVVGCLVLLILCCVMARRRRRLRNPSATSYTAGGPGAGFYGTGGRPLFGAGGMFPLGKQNPNQNTTLPQHQQPAGGGYGYGNGVPNSYTGPTQNAAGGGYMPPPPPYGKEGSGYAPPPGPPPPAHTTGGQNDHFVGGFRS
ncbi:hypothetical protein EV359DRAFT_64009 [Lentinula novae-zelandiae]|nr:hypothetical protein EV359DRAFT_64009 [Lentinula novae-zelandiae]